MGGFVRKDDGSVITLDILLELLDAHLVDVNALRKVAKKEIDDHSKGDLLSKALVTLQTTWFVVECITRWQQKLLLTELEVVTLAFAVLNMLTYGFWWHKPLDVLCPVQLDIHNAPIAQTPSNNRAQHSNGGGGDTELSHFLAGSPQTPSAEVVPKAGIIIRGVRAVLKPLSTTARVVKTAFGRWRSGVAQKFELGWIDGILEVIRLPIVGLFDQLRKLFETSRIGRYSTHVPTFYAADLGDDVNWGIVLYICCFVGMVFGGIHFISWNARFPTPAESLLWRISSVILVAEPFLIAILNFLVSREFDWDIPRVIFVFFGLFSSIIGPVAYILARSCLLVLAFLTLHRLPAEAFETASWTSYIPHL